MARGWESKSVEQQQEEAVSGLGTDHPRLTPEQVSQDLRRRGIELSRTRTLQQLERASNPRHREMLQAALAELEEQLKLEK